MSLNQDEVLERIEDSTLPYAEAYYLLVAAIPGIEKKFKRLDKQIVNFLAEVKKEFPDAQYYTASGGFNLMLGASHSEGVRCTPRPQLIALSGQAKIGDGDF